MSKYHKIDEDDLLIQKKSDAPLLTEEVKNERSKIISPPKNEQIDYTNNNNANEMTCRCCLGGIEDGGDFISPCLCKGSMKWVHRHCLDEWRVKSPNPNSFYQCDQCLYHYELIYKERNSIFDYIKYIVLCILDFTFIILAWQLLVGVCTLICWLIDYDTFVVEEVLGNDFNKPLGLYIFGNLLFLFCLGVLGIVLGFAYIAMKLLGCLSSNERRNVSFSDITYTHSYSRTTFFDYFFCWYILTHNNHNHYGPCYLGPCCLEICSCSGSCRDVDCLNADCGDCGNLGSCSGGGGDGEGLAIIGVILIVVIIVIIVIGAIIGVCLLVYFVISILNRRYYIIKRRDQCKVHYIKDLNKNRT